MTDHINGHDNDRSHDPVDALFKQAVEERVTAAPEPRPFWTLEPDPSLRERQGIFDMFKNNQRGLMVLATAAVAIVAIGGWAAISRNGDDISVITPADTTAPAPTTTDAPSTTARETTEQPTTTLADDIDLNEDDTGVTPTETDPGDALDENLVGVRISCTNGDEPIELDLGVESTDDIDDVVNGIDVCEGAGGLASVSYAAPCGAEFRQTTIEAIDGALPDFATLDVCEG